MGKLSVCYQGQADSFFMYNNYSDGSLPIGFEIGFWIFYFVILAASYIAFGLTFGALYAKMGQPRWKAWVPVYCYWPFFEFAGFNGAIALLSLSGIVPFVGFVGSIFFLVYSIRSAHRISRAFGKGIDPTGWTVLYVFFPWVWAGILGYGPSQIVASPLPPTWPGNFPPAPPAAPSGYYPPEPPVAPQPPVPPAAPAL